MDEKLPLDRWTRQLTQIASRPLQHCARFPQIAQRFEDFWRGQLKDGPIFIATANSNPARPIDRRLELLQDPDAWMAAKIADMKQTHRVGDALPFVRIDFGAVALGALLGAKIEFGSDTTWTEAFIDDDWTNAPQWILRDDNPWWILLRKLLARVADDAAGKYIVCTPDLGGSADVLLNMRGSGGLCMDAIDNPRRVRDAIDAIYPVWKSVFAEQYRLTVERGAGIFHWLHLWSNTPYMIPACDFNYMIGPDEFAAICADDIRRQAATAGRAVYHLDGPGAARHIDALLDMPELTAIQFTPGEGAPSALAWVEMFRKIQSRGKSVVVFCPFDEVLPLCKQVDTRSLALLVTAPSAMALDELHTKLRSGTMV